MGTDKQRNTQEEIDNNKYIGRPDKKDTSQNEGDSRRMRENNERSEERQKIWEKSKEERK